MSGDEDLEEAGHAVLMLGVNFLAILMILTVVLATFGLASVPMWIYWSAFAIGFICGGASWAPSVIGLVRKVRG